MGMHVECTDLAYNLICLVGIAVEGELFHDMEPKTNKSFARSEMTIICACGAIYCAGYKPNESQYAL